MMAEIFKSALVTSLAGGVLTLIIALAHPFTKRRFSAGWNYYVWLAVMVVMLCPARISLPHRAREAVQPASVTVTETDAAATDNAATVQVTEQTEATPINIEPVRATGKPFGAKADDVLNALAYIWVITAAALFAARLTGYALFCRRMRKSSYVTDLPQLARYTKRRVTVRRSKGIASPLIVGVFRPTLLMPDTDLNDEQLHYVLLHETTHLKRGDILYKWLAAVVKCVHWFNPAVYFMAARVNTECEISCDAAVTSGMTRGEETGYIDTILALLSNGKRTVPLTTGMTGGKRVLRRRFTMIKDKRVIGKATRALSACLAVVMTAAAVFAGGVLADGVLGTEYEIDIYSAGERVELTNQPFVKNNTVYLPLREMMEKEGITDISYNSGDYAELLCAPISRNGVTYVPYDFFDELKSSGQGLFDDITVTAKGGNTSLAGTLYRNDDLNFEVTLPLDWVGKYGISEEENSVSFVQTATYDKYGAGTLCRVERVSPEAADELLNMLGGSELLYRGENYAYIYEIPTDVQYPVWADHDEEDVAIAAEYEEMFEQVDVIKNSFELTDNTETAQPFTDEEVAAARAVVEEYYRANAAHDRAAVLATTTWEDSPNMELWGDETITIDAIRYDPYDVERENYIKYGAGSVNGTKYEDVIVFRMDFTVSFPEGSTYRGAWNEGEYTDWSMILIRSGKDGKWLIDDQGY